jgi:hypothetical protein
MITLVTNSSPSLSLVAIEGAATAIAVAVAFAWPDLLARPISRMEKGVDRLARRQGLCVALVAFSAILLRLAILPIHPIPLPSVSDDFSNLLAADTFAHGRLSNPTPAMWMHFETIHVDMKPTYASMYFPAQGLIMAAGIALFGHPWFGILIFGGLMCGAICWMLQGWLPPSWALLGGFLAVLRLGLFSYWTNSYHTAGVVSALGGALVLGVLPRLKKSWRATHFLLMAAGMVCLILSRPYEGMLLCLPVVAVLGKCVWTEKRPSAAVLCRRALPAAGLLLLGAAWLGYYDKQAFGNPLTLPYSVNRATYAMAPYYVWQEPRPAPAYHHEEMRRFYEIDELNDYLKIHSVSGFPTRTLAKAIRGVYFFSGLALVPPLFLLSRALRDRRMRFLSVGLCILAAGMAVEVYLFPHYLAPFTAAFYAVGLQAMRHLRQCKPGGKKVGEAIARYSVVICVLMAGVRLFDQQLGCPVPGRPVSVWISNWFGPDHFVPERKVIERRLEAVPGGQLAIVRYSPTHNPIDEWVFNGADIDGSKIIWARDMDEAKNRELIGHYQDRKIWLVQPDAESAQVTPYPVADQVTAASR